MKVGKLYRVVKNYPDGSLLPLFGLYSGVVVFVYDILDADTNPHPDRLPELKVWHVKLLVPNDKVEDLRCIQTTWDKCFERIL